MTGTNSNILCSVVGGGILVQKLSIEDMSSTYFILHVAGGKLGVIHAAISFSGKLLGSFFCFKFYSATQCVLTWALAISSQVSGAVQSSPSRHFSYIICLVSSLPSFSHSGTTS